MASILMSPSGSAPAVDLEIRALGPPDCDRLLGLWREAGLPHRPGGRDSPRAILAQMRRDPSLFLGAFLDNRLVGSVVASFDGRKGWVNRLAVVPGERRRGIARGLIAEAEGLLRGEGALVIAALVEEDNDASLAFFRACGYELERHVLYLTKRDPLDR